MTLRIDATSPVPASEQLRAQLIEQVRSGELAPQAKLPTVRELAAELGLAAGTVARAYRLLEDDGVIETFGRRGTFVAASADPLAAALETAARAYAEAVRTLGVDAEEALRVVGRALR